MSKPDRGHTRIPNATVDGVFFFLVAECWMDDSPFKDLRRWQLLVQKSEAPKMIESKARQAIPPRSNRRLKTSSRMTPWENHNHYQNDREFFLAVNQRFYKLQRSGCAQDVVCQYRGELLTYIQWRLGERI